jgi:hypothetical protein
MPAYIYIAATLSTIKTVRYGREGVLVRSSALTDITALLKRLLEQAGWKSASYAESVVAENNSDA